MPQQERIALPEQQTQPIERVTLDQLNQAPVHLEAGQYGGEAVWIDISASDRAAHGITTEHYNGDGHAYDYRGGTPMFMVVTGGNKPEHQVTYTVMSETSESGPTGELHIVGKNFTGEQVDFAVLGDKEIDENRVVLGREYHHGERTGSEGRDIAEQVSRKAVTLEYSFDRESGRTVIEVRDNSTNKNTEVRGAQYQEPERAVQPARRQEKVGKFAGKSLLSKLGVIR